MDHQKMDTAIHQGPRIIEHSGLTYISVGWCRTHQCSVWPIEEFFARFSLMPEKIREKLRSLNPNGKCEVELPKGCPRSWEKLKKWATPMERV